MYSNPVYFNDVWSSVDANGSQAGVTWLKSQGTIQFAPRAGIGMVIANDFNLNQTTQYAYVLGGASLSAFYNDVYYSIGRQVNSSWLAVVVGGKAPWSARTEFATSSYRFNSGVLGVVIAGGFTVAGQLTVSRTA